MELIHTDKTVTLIALETGFADDRRLIIAFKKKHGITPLQYRKKQKNSSWAVKCIREVKKWQFLR